MTMRCGRRGVSAVEVIVAAIVILTIVATVLPYFSSSREAARRSHCRNSLRAIGVALKNYETTFRNLPSGGKGTVWNLAKPGSFDPSVNTNVTQNGTAFQPQSALTLLLPYIEGFPTREPMHGDLQYNASGNGPREVHNRKLAGIRFDEGFVCPSNPVRVRDPHGYGDTDYVPTVFTDVTTAGDRYRDVPEGTRYPATENHPRARHDGFLSLWPGSLGLQTDGTSNTIAFAESVGRDILWTRGGMVSVHSAPAGTQDTCGGAGQPAKSGYRCPNRWADPDNAIGVSGPPVAPFRTFNNHPLPLGGPVDCLWSQENCGPHDEVFGFHPDGIMACFGDGHVRYIGNKVENVIFARMIARNDGDAPDFGCGSVEER